MPGCMMCPRSLQKPGPRLRQKTSKSSPSPPRQAACACTQAPSPPAQGSSTGNAATVALIHAVRDARTHQSIQAFFTIDAGPHVKIFCAPSDLERVIKMAQGIPGVPRSAAFRTRSRASGGVMCLLLLIQWPPAVNQRATGPRAFGELRSLLQQPQTPRSWRQICRWLDARPSGLDEGARSYLREHLRRWPPGAA